MKRLWLGFVAVLVISFSILGWIGTRIYQQMPPIPDRVVTPDGVVVIDKGEHTGARPGKPLRGRGVTPAR